MLVMKKYRKLLSLLTLAIALSTLPIFSAQAWQGFGDCIHLDIPKWKCPPWGGEKGGIWKCHPCRCYIANVKNPCLIKKAGMNLFAPKTNLDNLDIDIDCDNPPPPPAHCAFEVDKIQEQLQEKLDEAIK